MNMLRAVAAATVIAAALQISGCAGPFLLPPSVAATPGQSTRLACEADEVQMCRGGGSTMRCSCTATPRVSF